MDGQEVNFEGSDNKVNVAGRDVIQDSQINVFQQFQATEYFEPKLDQYKPPEFPEPKCANRIHDALLKQRVILMGDSPEIDNSALCRHFAWRLRETLSGHSNGALSGVAAAVQEWGRGTGTPNLILTLRQTKEKTIFILPQIKPQDVGYNLRKLADAASEHKHYVIASTDDSSQTWRLPDDVEQQFWLRLSPADVYEPDDLAEILAQKLGDAAAELKGLSHQNRFAPDQPLAGHSTIQEISQQLRTPENISLFVRLLCVEKQPISASTVSHLIESAKNDQHTLGLWYRSLTPRNQMLALGLSLFEQLFDDQFFSAFEYLVEGVWRRRDESLRAIDYCDLDELRNFFTLVQSGGYGINIQGRLPDQRRKFFEAAWNSHRRQLITALPVMAQLAKASVRGGGNRELYGTYERRDQIRRAVSDSISDIGLISPQSVEEPLLILAADRDLAIQAIAARAIARWREREEEKGKEALLIQTLKKWEQDTRFLKIISSFIEGESAEQKEDPIYYIRATIALTTGYAAYYDPPNQLSEELCELLKEMAGDRNPFVRHRFCEFTLPVVTRLHPHQLKDMLWEMALQKDLIDHVAWSLAEAYRVNPDEVEQILEEWMKRLQKNRPSQIRYTEQSDYEKRLATIALTYGWIEYAEGKSERGFELLQHILKKEESPFVRHAVTIAMSRQAKQDFEKVAPKIQRLMAHVAAREQNEIVEILDNVYFDQRSKMRGGDGRVKARDLYIDVWTDGKRQSTAIEKVMVDWVKDSSHPAAQRIATQTVVAFAKSLDRDENRKIDQLLNKRRQDAERTERIEFQIASQTSIQPKEYSLDSYTSWVLWVVSRNKSDGLSNVLEGLFHEVLAQRAVNRPALEFVMERWRRSPDPKLAEIAQGLDQAIWWRDHKGAVLGLSLVGLITLLLILYFVFSSL